MRELAERRGEAARSADEAQRFREAARRLSESGSDGTAADAGEQPADPARSPDAAPWRPDEDTVDARPDADELGDLDRGREAGRMDLLPDDAPGEGAFTDAPFGERLLEAADDAERAIEQRRVPRRYRELVRDVFQRYRERAGEETGASPLGRDADAPEPSASGGEPE